MSCARTVCANLYLSDIARKLSPFAACCVCVYECVEGGTEEEEELWERETGSEKEEEEPNSPPPFSRILCMIQS